jgi:preprotein translocase subunit YajC
MGNTMILAATKSTSSSTSLLPILIIVVLFMLVYMTMTRRSRARRAAQMQTDIVPGAQVRTTSGMYGTVTSVVDNDDLMVEVAPGVNIRMMRRAVVLVPQDASTGVPPEPPSADGASPDEQETHTDSWDTQERNV